MKPSQLAQGIVQAILYLVLIALALYTLFSIKITRGLLGHCSGRFLGGTPHYLFLKKQTQIQSGDLPL